MNANDRGFFGGAGKLLSGPTSSTSSERGAVQNVVATLSFEYGSFQQSGALGYCYKDTQEKSPPQFYEISHLAFGSSLGFRK